MDFIKAYADKNAVKVIAYAINFNQNLATDDIKRIIGKINATSYFQSNFPKTEDQTEISLTVTPDGAPQQTITKNGIVLHSSLEENSAWMININKEIILITCKEYSRWANISGKAYEHLQELIKIIDHTVNIAQITLEYLDEFEILNSSEDWKEELFRNDSKYLNTNIYSLNDFWHINQGYFVQLPDLNNKHLDTININYFADEKDNLKDKVSIRVQHKLIIEPVKPINDIDYIKTCYESLHIHSKGAFENIVSDKVLETFNRGEET